MNTLVVRGGRVIDPDSGTDAELDVIVRGGRIVGVENATRARGDREIDATGAVVTPGLLDIHGHWFEGSPYGIDPRICLRGGVTTTADAGTSGYANFSAFRRLNIDAAPLRVLAFVHVASAGLAATAVGELEDIRYASPREAAATVMSNRDIAVGVKVRIGRGACGANLDAALEAALEAGALAGVPVMVDIHDGADVSRVLRQLRRGDILTHCFVGTSVSIVHDSRVLDDARAARARGVVFDIGHGAGSFAWWSARAAIEDGFPPDTISTDLHRYSVEGPAHDLPTTMAKLLHLGLSLTDVVAAVTTRPARILGRDDLGTLRTGSKADIAVMRVQACPIDLTDASGQAETGAVRLGIVATVLGGRAIDPRRVRRRLRPLLEPDFLLVPSMRPTV